MWKEKKIVFNQGQIVQETTIKTHFILKTFKKRRKKSNEYKKDKGYKQGWANNFRFFFCVCS